MQTRNIRIAVLGTGAWGFSLAKLLAEKDVHVTLWGRSKTKIAELQKTRLHPNIINVKLPPQILCTHNLEEAVTNADLIIESVTSSGIREVFEQIKKELHPRQNIVMTSKGIEQHSMFILPEVLVDILGEEFRPSISLLSGPSFADEVSRNLPTSVTLGAYSIDHADDIAKVFQTSSFRVYPNRDIRGVALGGALKNVIAIACGISDGLKLGNGARASLMTRGLHEIAKLTQKEACLVQTIYGLSGMGDLFMTCSSLYSRNLRFGKLLAEGCSAEVAKQKIGMVVEGAYTCVSALELAKKHEIQMPITEMVHAIISNNVSVQQAVHLLMQRQIKEEVL